MRDNCEDLRDLAMIDTSDLENLEIEIPDFAIQKKIADVLSSLNRKIVQNTDINPNLWFFIRRIYSIINITGWLP